MLCATLARVRRPATGRLNSGVRPHLAIVAHNQRSFAIDIQKNFLRQYLSVVAINQGLMDRDVADALARYDRAMFARLIQARIEHLKSESTSETAFFPPEYYSGGIQTMTEALTNLDAILSTAA